MKSPSAFIRAGVGCKTFSAITPTTSSPVVRSCSPKLTFSDSMRPYHAPRTQSATQGQDAILDGPRHLLGVHVERSTKTSSKRLAQQFLKKWESEIERGEFATKNEPTFLVAAVNYMKASGERKFVKPLLDHFGETPLRLINQAAVDAAAVEIYPKQTPATRNRQVYTPVSAILKSRQVSTSNFAAEEGFARPGCEPLAVARTGVPNLYCGAHTKPRICNFS